ncbi:hypothetical protein ACFL4N_09680 [Thermodesulfobacteriota bacterium]
MRSQRLCGEFIKAKGIPLRRLAREHCNRRAIRILLLWGLWVTAVRLFFLKAGGILLEKAVLLPAVKGLKGPAASGTIHRFLFRPFGMAAGQITKFHGSDESAVGKHPSVLRLAHGKRRKA